MNEGRSSKLKNHLKVRLTLFFMMFLFLGIFFMPFSSPQPTIQNMEVNQNTEGSSMAIDGQILYSPMYSGITYLRESNGALNHTWSSSYLPGVMVRWLGDGTMLRTIRVGVGPYDGGGAGGGVAHGAHAVVRGIAEPTCRALDAGVPWLRGLQPRADPQAATRRSAGESPICPPP